MNPSEKEEIEKLIRESVTVKVLKDCFQDQQRQISGQEDRISNLEKIPETFFGKLTRKAGIK